jgi:hypothetical protein
MLLSRIGGGYGQTRLPQSLSGCKEEEAASLFSKCALSPPPPFVSITLLALQVPVILWLSDSMRFSPTYVGVAGCLQVALPAAVPAAQCRSCFCAPALSQYIAIRNTIRWVWVCMGSRRPDDRSAKRGCYGVVGLFIGGEKVLLGYQNPKKIVQKVQ